MSAKVVEAGGFNEKTCRWEPTLCGCGEEFWGTGDHSCHVCGRMYNSSGQELWTLGETEDFPGMEELW